MENEKKKYSVDELLTYAYEYNQIPEILFAKDKECRYIFTSEIESLIDGGEEHSILGKKDLGIPGTIRRSESKCGNFYRRRFKNTAYCIRK